MRGAATQLDLAFDPPPQNERPARVAGATIAAQFDSFHALNPHVYVAIVSLARELKRQGWRKAGMKQIFEQLRWRYSVATRGDQWRMNNNYTAHYARLVMSREPDLEGFFDTRERQTS